MKFLRILERLCCHRRSPCGERGLKCPVAAQILPQLRRSPCGERGLKSAACCGCLWQCRRSPCGERGLKCRQRLLLVGPRESLPVRGAWIEICAPCARPPCPGSLPVRGAWIEIP